LEFLLFEPTFQPHHMPFIKNLATLGIEATLRVVDPVQFRARLDDFDFDITIERFSMAATPGDSLRPFFSSQAAKIKGSKNLAGIASPALDALMERIIGAENRADLKVACRAFDRVFRAGRYWIPQWYRSSHPIAYWDVLSHPPTPPRYLGGVGAIELWWFDREKAAKADQAKP
jgi:microcin C transport system substrate-binding protein